MSGLEAAAMAKASAGLLARLVGPIVRWYGDRWGKPLRLSHRKPPDGGVWTLGLDRLLLQSDLIDVPGPRPASIRRWLESSYGALEVGERRDEVIFESTSERPIFITSIDIEIEDRDASGLAALVRSPSAGAVTVTLLGVDLTKGKTHEPVVVNIDGSTQWTSEPFFQNHGIGLSAREMHPVALISRTGTDTVKWRLTAEYRIRRRNRKLTFPDPSRDPLVTSGITSAQADQLWMCGVGGLPHAPFLRAAYPEEF